MVFVHVLQQLLVLTRTKRTRPNQIGNGCFRSIVVALAIFSRQSVTVLQRKLYKTLAISFRSSSHTQCSFNTHPQNSSSSTMSTESTACPPGVTSVHQHYDNEQTDLTINSDSEVTVAEGMIQSSLVSDTTDSTPP